MIDPFLSRPATSDHSPVFTVDRKQQHHFHLHYPYKKEPSGSPINWDANVFNFVTDCQHPGLVRRNSLAGAAANATGDQVSGVNRFRRQHQRNLSAATTVGLSRCPDNHQSKWMDQSRVAPCCFQYYNHNSRQCPTHAVNFSRPAKYGHTRNISDPIGGRDFYRVDVRPVLPPLDVNAFDYHGFLPFSQQLSYSASPPEPLDGRSFSGDLRGIDTPNWQVKSSGWDEKFDGQKKRIDPMSSLANQRLAEVTIDLEDDDDTRCLIGCLQPCASPIMVLIGLFSAMFIQTMVVNGLINSMLTTLERRFNFTTRQIGYVISCSETSGVLTTVAISFVDGRRHNRLRLIGFALLLLACSFAVFAVPHFLIPAYNPDQASTGLQLVLPNRSLTSLAFPTPTRLPNKPDLLLCVTPVSEDGVSVTSDPTGLAATCPTVGPDPGRVETDLDHKSATTKYMLLVTFCVAMFLIGIGASPVHVLAPTYLWDNFTDKEYPIYSAIFYSAGGLGPACGFLAGAGFLSVYIDSPWTLPRPGLDRNSPVWLGAWWLGMLTCSLITLLVALPVVTFPKRLSRPELGLAQSQGDDQEQLRQLNQIEEMGSMLQPNRSGSVLQQVPSLWSFKTPSSPHLGHSRTPVSNSVPRTAARYRRGPLPTALVGSPEKRATSETILPPMCQPNAAKAAGTAARLFSMETISTSTAAAAMLPPRAPAVPVATGNSAPSSTPFGNTSVAPSGKVGGSDADGGKLPVPVANGEQEEEQEGPLTPGLLRPSTTGSRCRRMLQRCIEFVLIIRRVLTNPIWLGVTVTSVLEHSIVAAFLTYAAKYLQELFQVPAYLASVHTGAVVVPGSLLGVLSGAVLMRQFRPNITQTLMGIWLLIAGTLGTTVILMCLGCSGNRLAGVTADYWGRPWPWKHGPASLVVANLTAPCNTNCMMSGLSIPTGPGASSSPRNVGARQSGRHACSAALFHPVCWRRGGSRSPEEVPPRDLNVDHDDGMMMLQPTDYLTFFNPCFAGCKVANLAADRDGGSASDLVAEAQTYSHCTCVTDLGLNPSGVLGSTPWWPGNSSGSGSSTVLLGNVTAGRCATNCPQHFVFLAVLFVHILLTGMLQNPSNVITLSCVNSEDSSVGLGLQIFFSRTLAYIPAPIYFGQLFDLVCQYRIAPEVVTQSGASCYPPEAQSSVPLGTPNGQLPGACQQYNLEGLPLVWLGAVLALKAVSLLGCTITWYLARNRCPPKCTSTSTADVGDSEKCQAVHKTGSVTQGRDSNKTTGDGLMSFTEASGSPSMSGSSSVPLPPPP